MNGPIKIVTDRDEYCDDCGEEMVNGWMTYTGEEYEGSPVVRIVCGDCHAAVRGGDES